MNTYKLKHLLTLVFMGCFSATFAQSLQSSYFMEGMTYRHQLNPAFCNESNYINLPFFVLGNFNATTTANMGVENFIYKYNQNGYPLTTFMNPDISGREFLDGLHDKNRLNVNLSMPIIAFGFYKWNGFNTFGINLKSSTSVNLPYALFDFMKNGMTDEGGTYYNVKDLNIRSNNYIELALGHSHSINERLTIGGKFKFLVGAGNAEAKIKNMDIYMSEDKWDISAQGDMIYSVQGLSYKTKSPNDLGQHEVDGFDFHNGGIAGFGAAIDLGAVYKFDCLLKGLTVSASLLDFGFINWKDGIRSKMVNSYTFDGFEHPIEIDPEDGSPGNIDDQIDKIGDNLEDFIRFYDDGTTGKRNTMLAASFNLGLGYEMPFYKKLSVGLLSTVHLNRPFTWGEARLSATVAPVKWFEASVNYGIGTFGSSLGWVLNFHPNGFNFFIGTDHQFTRITPQFVPIGNANSSVNVGFNVTWGKKKIANKRAQLYSSEI